MIQAMFAEENSATRVASFDADGFNAAMNNELTGVTGIGCLGRAIGRTEFDSKAQAIEAGKQYWTIINNFIINIEAQQAVFDDQVVQDKYIAMEESYAAMLQYALLVTEKVIKGVWDAKTELQYEVTTDSSPWQMLASAKFSPSGDREALLKGRAANIKPGYSSVYKDLPQADGQSDKTALPNPSTKTVPRIDSKTFDEEFDKFAKSNKLEGKEFLLIPAGRQVKFNG
jgi:hypothetical protein